jgi:hypothetical protein
MKNQLLNFVTLLLAALSSAVAQGDRVIYDGNLENGWQDWGWATHSYTNPAPVYNGEPYSVSVTPIAYSYLYIANNAFDSSPYTNFSFYANGGATGGQVLSVVSEINGQYQPYYSLGWALPANQWTNVVVPLSALNAANSPAVTGFWIGNSTGNSMPTFYLDDIVLVAGSSVVSIPTNVINIDASQNRHPISPLIYGTAFATSNQLADLNFTMNRSGGNEESTYNWQINAHGKGADYYFESYPDSSSTPGQSADSVVAASKAAGAQALITVPMMDWGPKLGSGRAILPSFSIKKYGAQTGHDPYFTDAGNGVIASSNALITWNDPNDSYTPVDTNFQKGYVQHLTSTWGKSTNGGVKFYIMDNEHSLWSSTHQDIHPVGPTMQEIFGKMVAYASMVKSVDPNAVVAGPEEWGWPGYLYSGYDQQWSNTRQNYNSSQFPDRTTNGGWDYMPWLLHQLHQYETTNGQRLLDYFTLHCYPQEGSVGGNAVDTATETLRNQSTRQFWDTNYVDPSWINSIIMLIPRMKAWVSTNYPGTKLGVTEYNWGAEPYISGATAQADLLGIFGREGLDLATRWTTPDPSTPTYLAMKIYRNYDGQKSTFGDTSVLASGPNPDNVAVFAAQRSSDNALTVVVVNKYLSGTNPLVINLANFNAASSAHVWQLNASNVIAHLPDVSVSTNAIKITVPSQSVTMFVVPARATALNFTPAPARTDGQFGFSLSGSQGATFQLQTSEDLIHWSAISTNSLTNSTIQFLFPGGLSAAFYRALSLN